MTEESKASQLEAENERLRSLLVSCKGAMEIAQHNRRPHDTDWSLMIAALEKALMRG